MRYASAAPLGRSRKIIVGLDPADRAPAGTGLCLIVFGGPDECGMASGRLRLTGRPQDLIINIGGCATSALVGGDVRIRYEFKVDDASLLAAGEEKRLTAFSTPTDASKTLTRPRIGHKAEPVSAPSRKSAVRSEGRVPVCRSVPLRSESAKMLPRSIGFAAVRSAAGKASGFLRKS